MKLTIKQARLVNELSMEEVAKKLGITRQTLYIWELKNKVPAHKEEEMLKLYNISKNNLK